MPEDRESGSHPEILIEQGIIDMMVARYAAIKNIPADLAAIEIMKAGILAKTDQDAQLRQDFRELLMLERDIRLEGDEASLSSGVAD